MSSKPNHSPFHLSCVPISVLHKLSEPTMDLIFLHTQHLEHPTPVFVPGESQGWGSLVGCCLWGRTESDTTEAT